MSEILGFALFFAAAFALAYAFLWVVGKFADRSPIVEAEPSRLDQLDHQTHRPAEDASTGSAGRCPNCRRQVTGLTWVIVDQHFGGGIDRVCHGCSGIGLYKGWYRAQLPRTANVYDIATALDMHDLDDIETFANGGDVA